ncbi:MAG: hypothetical protein DDG59_11880 [Anaerolineae bacterium]|jgi:hypothetical protein|nr:MAG: hypothetical protein DDG59_11880 [Anaerolineae bacterium]
MKKESSPPEVEKGIKTNSSSETRNAKKRIDYVFDFYQASMPLLTALVWPLAIIIIISIFREPLFQTLQQLPSVVSRSTSIEIAGVSIKVDERIAGINDPELKAALSNLSPTALRLLVDVGKGGLTTTSKNLSEQERNALVELRDKGLIELDMNYSHPTNPELDIYYRQTDLGKRAYNFVMDILFGQLLTPTTGEK